MTTTAPMPMSCHSFSLMPSVSNPMALPTPVTTASSRSTRPYATSTPARTLTVEIELSPASRTSSRRSLARSTLRIGDPRLGVQQRFPPVATGKPRTGGSRPATPRPHLAYRAMSRTPANARPRPASWRATRRSPSTTLASATVPTG